MTTLPVSGSTGTVPIALRGIVTTTISPALEASTRLDSVSAPAGVADDDVVSVRHCQASDLTADVAGTDDC
jgi:hypothetical protein